MCYFIEDHFRGNNFRKTPTPLLADSTSLTHSLTHSLPVTPHLTHSTPPTHPLTPYPHPTPPHPTGVNLPPSLSPPPPPLPSPSLPVPFLPSCSLTNSTSYSTSFGLPEVIPTPLKWYGTKSAHQKFPHFTELYYRTWRLEWYQI